MRGAGSAAAGAAAAGPPACSPPAPHAPSCTRPRDSLAVKVVFAAPAALVILGRRRATPAIATWWGWGATPAPAAPRLPAIPSRRRAPGRSHIVISWFTRRRQRAMVAPAIHFSWAGDGHSAGPAQPALSLGRDYSTPRPYKFVRFCCGVAAGLQAPPGGNAAPACSELGCLSERELQERLSGRCCAISGCLKRCIAA